MSQPTLIDATIDRSARYSLAEAARRFFPDPTPCPQSLIRWGTLGAKMRDGQRLKLRLQRHPGRWTVSELAIQEFLELLTTDRLGEPAQHDHAESEMHRLSV